MGTDPIEPTEFVSGTQATPSSGWWPGASPSPSWPSWKLSLGQITEDFAWRSSTNRAGQGELDQEPIQHARGGPRTWAAAPVRAPQPSWSRRRAARRFGRPAIGTSPINRGRSPSTPRRSPTTPRSGYRPRRRVNACWRAAGTSTITIDNPLPHTNFDHYTITGLATGGAVVWTQYQIANTALWPRVTNQSTYPQPIINGTGGATLASTPIGIISAATARPSHWHSPIVIATEQSTSSRRPIRSPITRALRTYGPTSRSTPIPCRRSPPRTTSMGIRDTAARATRWRASTNMLVCHPRPVAATRASSPRSSPARGLTCSTA